MARNPYVFHFTETSEEDFLKFFADETETEFTTKSASVRHARIVKNVYVLHTAVFTLMPRLPSGTPDTSGTLVSKKYLGSMVRISYYQEKAGKSPRMYRNFPVWVSYRHGWFPFWRKLDIDRVPYVRTGLENIGERISRRVKTS